MGVEVAPQTCSPPLIINHQARPTLSLAAVSEGGVRCQRPDRRCYERIRDAGKRAMERH
jgi:hypothetical protein